MRVIQQAVVIGIGNGIEIIHRSSTNDTWVFRMLFELAKVETSYKVGRRNGDEKVGKKWTRENDGFDGRVSTVQG